MAPKRSKQTAAFGAESREQTLSDCKRTRLSFGKPCSSAPDQGRGSTGSQPSSMTHDSVTGSKGKTRVEKKQAKGAGQTQVLGPFTPVSTGRTRKRRATAVSDITALSSESDSDDESGDCKITQSTLGAASHSQEILDLKQKLSSKEHETAVALTEALAAKRELQRYKLSRLETAVSERVANGEVETVRRDLTQSLAKLARITEQLQDSKQECSKLQVASNKLTESVEYVRNRLHESQTAGKISDTENLALNKRVVALELKINQLEQRYDKAKLETDSVRTAHLEEKTALRARLFKTRSRLNRVEGVKIPTIMENHRLEMELAREMVSKSTAKLAKLTKLHKEVETAIKKVKREF